MEPFEGFEENDCGGALSDNSDNCNGGTFHGSVNDTYAREQQKEELGLLQHTYLVNQRQSCRERRAPCKLTYNTNFYQINVSKIYFPVEPICYSETDRSPDRLQWKNAIEEELFSKKE